MSMLEERRIACPYCGESISILIDPAGDNVFDGAFGAGVFDTGGDAVQEYIEDCQVCCRPISITVSVSIDGSTEVFVAHENE